MSARLHPAPARPLIYWLKSLRLWPRRQSGEGQPDTRHSDPGALPHLSDRMARDIGLSPSETEYARLQYPSQTGPRHPSL